MTLEQAKKRAEQVSSQMICPVFLYQITVNDHQEYKLTAMEDYLNTSEFRGFNGEVIAEFYDGTEC